MRNWFRICAALLTVAAACSTPSPYVAHLLPLPDSAARAVALSPGPVYARAVIRHMPRLAAVAGGLPIVVPPERPIAGKPWTLAFTTRPSAPFPDVPAALLVSFEPLGDAHTIPGARGGMLQVPLNPKLMFHPGGVDWLTQSGGVIRLDLTFQPWHVGTRISCQLLVEDPVAGVLTSPAVALTVGNR